MILALVVVRAYARHRWCSWLVRRAYGGRRAWLGADAWPFRPAPDPHTGRPDLAATVAGWWRTDAGVRA